MESILDTLGGIGEDVKTFIIEKPVTSAAIGVGVVGAGAGVAVLAASGKKTKKRTKRGRARDRKFISKQKHERHYKRKKGAKIYKRKGRWLSRTKKAGNKKTKKRIGKVYYTKKGQPYKIMSSGKARFIKKTKRRK